ncbi:MAG: hypothetical protein AAGE52_07735 [Myxococcota bacterium]
MTPAAIQLSLGALGLHGNRVLAAATLRAPVAQGMRIRVFDTGGESIEILIDETRRQLSRSALLGYAEPAAILRRAVERIAGRILWNAYRDGDAAFGGMAGGVEFAWLTKWGLNTRFN